MQRQDTTLRALIQSLPTECAMHILKYTYHTQDARLLQEIRDQEKKHALYETHYHRMNESFNEIYGPLLMPKVMLGDIEIYIYRDDCTVHNKHIIRKMISENWYREITENQAEKLFYRAWLLMTIAEIGEYMKSHECFITMVWYIDPDNINRLPPYSWMYDENRQFKNEYFAIIDAFRPFTVAERPFIVAAV